VGSSYIVAIKKGNEIKKINDDIHGDLIDESSED
jgi:hypothetical protein